MATNSIYVETEEEIPEVVERLRRFRGEDTMLVLPSRSKIGQSRFNFQLLRDYAARLGKRVTVVCDDPAVQKMAAESGFAVFGAVGIHGEGIPSEAPPAVPAKSRWRGRTSPDEPHIAVAAPARLITKSATELKPGRFALYAVAATVLMIGLVGAAIYVPSASLTLVASAAAFSEKDVEISAEPGKAPIRVRTNIISKSDSSGFKTTGLNSVAAAQAIGVVTYTNNCKQPKFDKSPGLTLPYGQRLLNTNGITFAQTSGDVVVNWAGGRADASVVAIQPGVAGNVGAGTITSIDQNSYDCLAVSNSAATGGGVDKKDTPQMTQGDFDAARAQLELGLRSSLADDLGTAAQPGEKLSETIVYNPPQFDTDHRPGDNVPSFSGTMSLQGEGDYFVEADVKKAFRDHLAAKVPANEQLLTESPIQVSYRILNANKGGLLTFLGTTSAFVAPKLDSAQIRAQVVGRPFTQAQFYLRNLPIKSSAIKELPISLPLMPLLLNRIDVHYVVEPGTAVAPIPSPTPSALPTPSPSP